MLLVIHCFCICRFEPSSVLDLISAIATNPKLWQGREMNASKSKSSDEGFMLLNDHQVKFIIDYNLLSLFCNFKIEIIVNFKKLLYN